MNPRHPDVGRPGDPGSLAANGTGAALGTHESEEAANWRLRAEELSERVQTWVQHRPGMALLVAAGLGFGMARLLSRRW